MNRQSKHIKARTAIAQKLTAMGLDVQDVPRAKGYDLLIGGQTRVALRVAFPGKYAHTVTVGGKRYTYNYRSWSFNFHRHGRWDRKYCDVFVCIAKRRGGIDEIFVIPAAAISGPTFSLHGAGAKPYRGRYAQYRDQWAIFTPGREGVAPSDEAVNPSPPDDDDSATAVA
jgi:hypothetical protein